MKEIPLRSQTSKITIRRNQTKDTATDFLHCKLLSFIKSCNRDWLYEEGSEPRRSEKRGR
jgi:hypothetical protein